MTVPVTAPACQVCSEPLDGMWDGLHPTCVAPPEPMLPRLGEILLRHQEDAARSRQVHIGPSQIGEPCTRRLAYFVHGVPPARPRSLMWAAQVGTACHVWHGEAVDAENKRLGRERYLIERRLPVAPEMGIYGNCDLYDTDTAEVIDLKFPGKYSLDKYRKSGPSPVYRVQVHLYGRGWEGLGFPVRSVRILFLPRASHLFVDAHEWAEPYSRQVADEALERLRQVAMAGVPADWEELPIDTEMCLFCPWHRPLAERPSERGCPGDGSSKKAASKALDGIVIT